METRKVEQRRRVNRKLRQRAMQKAVRAVRAYFERYLDRQIAYGRLREDMKGNQKYYVAYNYDVVPFEEPEEEKDPYEGEDLVNIDHMDPEFYDDERQTPSS